MDEGEHAVQTPAFEQEAPGMAARFPHIIDRLRALWDKPAECKPFLDSLLVDERGHGEGFPAPILFEIMHLNELFKAAHQTGPGGDVWTDHESVL